MVKNTLETAHGYFQIPPSELLKRCGPPLFHSEIPRDFIYGIEKLEDFIPKSLNKLRNTYQEIGSALFQKWPLACCAIPMGRIHYKNVIIPGEEYILAIIDGNHRRRVGDEYHVSNYPVDLYSVEQAVKFFKNQNEDQTVGVLFEWISQAEHLADPINQALRYRF